MLPSPAVAAGDPPVVTPESCERQGGTYSQTHESRTCTTTVTNTQLLRRVSDNTNVNVNVANPSGLQATYQLRRVQTVTTTETTYRGTTTSQTSTSPYVVETFNHRCYLNTQSGQQNEPVSSCEEAGLYDYELVRAFIEGSPNYYWA